MPQVTALSLTPIKGTRLHTVPAVEIGPDGAAGDRRFMVVDARERMINGKHAGALHSVVAQWSDGSLRLRCGERPELSGAVELGEPIVVRFFSAEREVRPVLGRWAQALCEHLGEPVRLVDAGSAVDRGRAGAVSLVSRGSLRRLAEQAGSDRVDARRFRMLIEVDGIPPHAEDGWVGRTLRIGEAELRFVGHVGRCLVTGRDPESGEVDLPTLDLLGAYRRGEASTEPLPFGIHGEVLRSGAVRVGDSVVVVD